MVQDSLQRWLIACSVSVLLSFPLMYVNSKLPYKILCGDFGVNERLA